MKINLKHVGGFLAVAAFAACSEGTPTGLETTKTVDGVQIHQVADIGMYKLQQQLVADEILQCETIDFEQFEGGTLSDPLQPLTFSALGVDVDVEITEYTDNSLDCGTGQVLIFDTSVDAGTYSGPDPDLVTAGQSVTPNLGNVATHQSCETPGTPNDANVEDTMRFTFPTGDWAVASFSALDQEGEAQDESIALRIDVATDGTQVGITDVNTDYANAVEVVEINPAASFTSTLDFEFDGSGAIDDIEVCKVVERGGEGCTPGYWRQSQHFGNWPVGIDYRVDQAFDGFCGSMDAALQRPESGNVCDLTLLQAVQLRGGGVNALMRHAAAAWLNAGSTVDFYYAQSEVEDMTEAALMSGMYEATKDGLADANEAGCPLGRAELDD